MLGSLKLTWVDLQYTWGTQWMKQTFHTVYSSKGMGLLLGSWWEPALPKFFLLKAVYGSIWIKWCFAFRAVGAHWLSKTWEMWIWISQLPQIYTATAITEISSEIHMNRNCLDFSFWTIPCILQQMPVELFMSLCSLCFLGLIYLPKRRMREIDLEINWKAKGKPLAFKIPMFSVLWLGKRTPPLVLINVAYLHGFDIVGFLSAQWAPFSRAVMLVKLLGVYSRWNTSEVFSSYGLPLSNSRILLELAVGSCLALWMSPGNISAVVPVFPQF